MAIIKICKGQPQLKVSLVQPGCDGSKLADWRNIQLIIKSPPCPPMTGSDHIFTGCWPGYDVEEKKEPPHLIPSIIYPAFDFTDDGFILFIFDNKLWRRPAGRYLGSVTYVPSKVCLVNLDIDLCNQPFLLDKVEVLASDCDI